MVQAGRFIVQWNAAYLLIQAEWRTHCVARKVAQVSGVSLTLFRRRLKSPLPNIKPNVKVIALMRVVMIEPRGIAMVSRLQGRPRRSHLHEDD